jgi:anti-sigma-K factor RskA
VTVHDEDQDTLAAEYVLGTLSAEEREQAEALRSFDPGFEAAVRQWERRLGELNVMVEAVEPSPETWEKIKAQISPDSESGAPEEQQSAAPDAALAAELAPSTTGPQTTSPSGLQPGKIERSADVIYLAGRVGRWRRLTFAFGALAALLAAYIAVWQIAPDLIPSQLRPPAAMMATARTPTRAPQDRLVAVLQQGPTPPAFLLTLDTQHRTLIVRRVSATPEAGRSYELWLIANRYPAPRSLGIVGNDEFTERPLPGNYDADTLRGASYAVSLEPAGGSKSGAPSGPVLFTGKAVESLPASPPPTPKT